MPWVRFDDQYPIHRKIAKLSDPAFRLHVAAIAWCARNLTDGIVPLDELDDVCAQVRAPERFATELADRKVGVWHPADYDCPSRHCAAPAHDEDGKPVEGWVIHDYLEYQPSRSKVLHVRAVRKVAGEQGGKRSGESRRSTSKAAGSKREAKPKQVGSGLVEPRTRSSLREEGTGGAPLRGGGAPPSHNPRASPGTSSGKCEFHMLPQPCHGCAADSIAADSED